MVERRRFFSVFSPLPCVCRISFQIGSGLREADAVSGEMGRGLLHVREDGAAVHQGRNAGGEMGWLLAALA